MITPANPPVTIDGQVPLPRLTVAAPMSGSGKTTLTAGLIAALRRRGLQVAPFKAGPDYVDPSYHTLAAGRPCRNLDAWLVPPERIPGVLAQGSAGADIALIEGVMGLFDGHSGADDVGSTAHIARLTETPVLLVLDIRAMAHTAAARVKGLREFDPRLRLAGVILNRAGSQRHAQMVREAIEGDVGLPVLGALPHDDALTLPERHLGLIPTAEPGRWEAWLARACEQVQATVDLNWALELARAAPPLRAVPLAETVRPVHPERPRIAVARDEAFSFRYEDNLNLLRAAGAELAFFSPLRDGILPSGSSLVYLCGGFPELYAEALSANDPLLSALHAAAADGMPIYAECGGLMYLTEAVVDFEDRAHPMVGLLRGRSVMTQRLTLGYRSVRVLADSWLWKAGEMVRGHEFHYSVWEGRPEEIPWLYQIEPDSLRAKTRPESTVLESVIASYVHLHFLAHPAIAGCLVAAATGRAQRSL